MVTNFLLEILCILLLEYKFSVTYCFSNFTMLLIFNFCSLSLFVNFIKSYSLGAISISFYSLYCT